MAKGAAKVQHLKMKPIDGPGFSLRGFRRAGDCPCSGILVHAKIAGVTGSPKMGRVCAGLNEVRNGDTVVRGAANGCGAIFGRNKGNRFGSA